MITATMNSCKYQKIEEFLSPFYLVVPCGHIYNHFVLIFHAQVLSTGSHGDKSEAIKYLLYNTSFIALLHTHQPFLLCGSGSFPVAAVNMFTCEFD